MSFLKNLHNELKNKSKLYWFFREKYVVAYCAIKSFFDSPAQPRKKRILFFGLHSLSHGGTEKFLQILAKHLDKEKHDVYFLYPDTLDEAAGYQSRFTYTKSGGVTMIPFTYTQASPQPPHFISGLNPNINSLIKGLGITTFVTAGAGSANYPFSSIPKTPIVLLNIFGQPNMQKNIIQHLCVSSDVANRVKRIIPENRVSVLPVPSEGPTPSSQEKGLLVRKKFNIPENEIVFGRIGRALDSIHDPIGINGFKIALEKRSDIHYLIMSPPPALVKQVQNEKIPNVYFAEPSSNEEDVWAFHAAIDVLAHFRFDGESYGLNIAESMLSGNPIISHKTHIWNSHLDYLTPEFARIAERNDANAYAAHMLEFAGLYYTGELKKLGETARITSENSFHIKNNIAKFESFLK